MNTLRIVSVALLLSLAAGGARGATISLTPTPADLYDLDHNYYYKWGFTVPFDASQCNVTSATLSFDNIRNWDNNTNDLYIRLLDSATRGVRSYVDNEASGDALAGQGILLKRYHNLSVTAQDITYAFSSSQLATLNQYLDNGNNAALGFDPDCHYYNDGVCLTMNYSQIPEPATMTVLGLGGLAVLLRRRKLASP